MKRVKTIDLQPCPKCGGLFIDVWKGLDTRKYHCECRKCHYASRESKFPVFARWKWNHEEICDKEEE